MLTLGHSISKAVRDKNHRLTNLRVDEVSVVTQPAILTAEEVDAGVGLPVIKMLSTEGVPDEIIEKLDLQENEDLFDFLNKLVSAAALSLQASDEVTDDHAFFYWPMKVFEDNIVMADPFGDLFSEKHGAWKLSYTRNEKGKFEFGTPRKLKAVFQEVEAVSEPEAKEEPVQKMLLPTVEALLDMCNKSGQSFSFSVFPDGSYTFAPFGPHTTPEEVIGQEKQEKEAISKVVEEAVEKATKALQTEIAKLRQRANGSGNENDGGIEPTDVTKNQEKRGNAGLWTGHLPPALTTTSPGERR